MVYSLSMDLKPSEIHIWTFSLSASAEETANYFDLLSPDEQIKAKRFHFEKHQQRYTVAHGMVRTILGLYLKLEPQQIQFTYNPHQKPYLDYPDDIFFNLSHSDDLGALAVTKAGEIGIDVEKITYDKKSEVARRYFSPTEVSHLQSLPENEQLAGFYKIWARKEAVIKANGEGLANALDTFSVPLADNPAKVILVGKKWLLIPVDLHKDYASAIAVENNVNSVSICKLVNQKPNIDSIINLD